MKNYYSYTLCPIISFILYSCDNGPSSNKATSSKSNESAQIKILEPTEKNNGSIEGVITGCAYNTKPNETSITLYYPGIREVKQINAILQYSGLSSNFKVYAANINNAIATIIGNKRYILYDPNLLQYTDKNSGNFWSSMSILAHEIGHHLQGHTITKNGSNPKVELEADKFSGFVLYKLGASLSQASAAMETLGSAKETATHPAKINRLNAIQQGWTEANNQRYDAAVPPPPVDIINPKGGIDEFGPKNLLDQDSYERLFINHSVGTSLINNLEGIILERPKYYYGEYLVLITRNYSDFIDGSLSEGDKASINLYDAFGAYEMVGRSGLSWLDGIMVPGRRIRFDVAVEGTAPNVFFTSIKSLPARR
jgi:hypothetical protein